MTIAIYFILFAFSLLISLLITGQAIGWADRLGMLDAPGHRKVHTQTKPRAGGLGIFIGFFVAISSAAAAALYFPSGILPQPLGEFLEHHKAGISREWIALLGLLAGGAIIFCGGVLDDKRDLSPKAKLGWQLAAALLLIGCGYRVDFHKVLWDHPAGEYLIAIPFTLFWMLFLMNAFNLLDNMDGLSAGVAAITTTFFAAYAHWQEEFFLAAAMATLVGALLGFLKYNWHPSRIFMGDGGALLVGFLIAAFTCRCTYFQTGEESRQGVLTLLTPLVIMAVPIFDTVTVVLIRLKNGKPIMEGDTNHFSHRLVALGLSQKHAVQVIYCVTIFTGLGALILRTATLGQAFLIVLQVLSVFGMIWVLESRQRRGKEG